MNDKTPKPDQPKPISKPPSESRDDRLKAALRANLMRRKAQVRGRASDEGQENE